MEHLTNEQREISKLEIQLDVCKRSKDAIRFQLSALELGAAEQSVQRMRYAVRWKVVKNLPSCFIAKVMRLNRAPLTQTVRHLSNVEFTAHHIPRSVQVH